MTVRWRFVAVWAAITVLAFVLIVAAMGVGDLSTYGAW